MSSYKRRSSSVTNQKGNPNDLRDGKTRPQSPSIGRNHTHEAKSGHSRRPQSPSRLQSPIRPSSPLRGETQSKELSKARPQSPGIGRYHTHEAKTGHSSRPSSPAAIRPQSGNSRQSIGDKEGRSNMSHSTILPQISQHPTPSHKIFRESGADNQPVRGRPLDRVNNDIQEQKEKQETKPAVPQISRYMRVKQNRQLKSCSERNSKSINSSLSDKRNIDVVFLIGYNQDRHNQQRYVEREIPRIIHFVKSFFSAFDINFCTFVHNSKDHVASPFTKEQSQLVDTLTRCVGGIFNERIVFTAVESVTSLPFRSKSLRILIDFACSRALQYKLSSRYAKILQRIDVNHIIAAFPGVSISHLGRQDPVNRFSLVDAMFESISFQFELDHPPSLPINILERFYMLYNPTRSEKPLEECQRIPFRIEAKLQRCEPVPSNYDTNLIPQLQEDCGEVFFDREVRYERDFTIYLATFSIGRETKHLDVIIPKTGLIDETKQDSPGLIQWMEEDMFLRQLGCTFANSFNERTSGLRLRVLPSFILRASIGGKRVAMLCQEHTSEKSSCFTQNSFTMKKGDICSRLIALSHFSYLVSRSSFLLTNFYGYHSGDEIVLTKLNLASNDVTRFGPYNPGMDGMRLFINNHRCNKYCKEVGLRRQEVDNLEKFSSEFKYFVNRQLRERMDVEDSKRKEAAVNQVDEGSRFSTNEENTEYIPCPACGGCGRIPVDRTSGQRIDDGFGTYSQTAQGRRNMYDSDAQTFNHTPNYQTTPTYPQQSTPPNTIPSKQPRNSY